MTDNNSGNINNINGKSKDIIIGHVKRVELLEIWNNYMWLNIGLIN